MILSETFQVAAIIDKLSLAWKDFKNYLKHKRNEMSIKDLIIGLSLKKTIEDLRRKGHTIRARPSLTLWNMVNVLCSRNPTTKEKMVRWDIEGEYLRSRSFKGNTSIVRSKVTIFGLQTAK